MSFTIWPPLATGSTTTPIVSVSVTAPPGTQPGQCPAASVDALPFVLVGAVIGAAVGKALGRREAIQKLTDVMSSRKRGGQS